MFLISQQLQIEQWRQFVKLHLNNVTHDLYRHGLRTEDITFEIVNSKERSDNVGWVGLLQ